MLRELRIIIVLPRSDLMPYEIAKLSGIASTAYCTEVLDEPTPLHVMTVLYSATVAMLLAILQVWQVSPSTILAYNFVYFILLIQNAIVDLPRNCVANSILCCHLQSLWYHCIDHHNRPSSLFASSTVLSTVAS